MHTIGALLVVAGFTVVLAALASLVVVLLILLRPWSYLPEPYVRRFQERASAAWESLIDHSSRLRGHGGPQHGGTGRHRTALI